MLAGASQAAPFLGVNLSTMLTRDKVGAGGVSYDWDAAAETLDESLGVNVVRAGLYCSDAAAVEEFATFSPFNCATGKPNDLSVVERMIDEDGLTVAPLVQINWATSQGEGAPVFDEALRADYYEGFGRHIGRTLARQVASGAVPYFELGNEPDHACVNPGNPWGNEPGHFNAECVDRVRASVLALQAGIRAGVDDAIVGGDAPVGTEPSFAVGTSGSRWGITDALWNAVPTASNQHPVPVRWDFTVVHWYYQNGYGNAVGDVLDQSTGFDNVNGAELLAVRNAAANFRDRYGKPLVVTEFGVFPKGAPGADESMRASSFTRLLTGLYNLAGEYNIAGLFAFTFSGPEGAGDGGKSGDYNLADLEQATGSYGLTAVGEAYRAFIEHPVVLTDPSVSVGLVSPSVGAVVSTPVPVFRGTGAPGASIQVQGNRAYCATVVDDAGAWSCASVLPPLGAGRYLGVVRQTMPGVRTTSALLDYTLRPAIG